ncbi:MAG: AmmeMemoRadiSam system protein A [Nannocystaceae bacterium]
MESPADVAPAPVPPLADASCRWLAYVARRALRDALAAGDPSARDLPLRPCDRPDDPRLDEPARLFVSWHDGEALVGCIGALEPHDALEGGVARYAVAAGMHDPRLPPADPRRWTALECEVSILGAPVLLAARGLAAIGEELTPGRDGVILRVGGRRAFFLPSVWRQLPRPEAFLTVLCRKAGADPRRDGVDARAEVLCAFAYAEPVAG